MATALQIKAFTNYQQTSVIVRETSGLDLDPLVNIYLVFFKGTVLEPNTLYLLTESQRAKFTVNGEVEIFFNDVYGTERLEDDWWMVQVTANTSDYYSNQFGFVLCSDLDRQVYARVNSIHIPEHRRKHAEDIFNLVLQLNKLKRLDSSTVNDRGQKATRTINALNKMLGL